MQPGFGYNQPGRKFPDDNAYKNRPNEGPKNFQPQFENPSMYHFTQQFSEEGNDMGQIPHHIKILFDSDEKLNFNPRAQMMNQGGMANMPNMQNMANMQNREQVRQMMPNQMNYPGFMMQPQNFNNLMNQSNDLARMAAAQKDLDVSGLSNRDNSMNQSLNNISRDSRTEPRQNLNSSKRNTSSRSNVKDKNYQLRINEDIHLIERIEISLNQITANHNKICPFCSKLIDIRKCNFQNISAFLSDTSRKYYLTHFDCYLKSNSNQSLGHVSPLTGIVEARVNSQINALTTIDTSNYLRSDRRAYFVNIEGYHPISSYLLFKIEKLCHGLEHATHRNHLLYLNLTNSSTSIFEPNSYTVPFSEFRIVMTIHTSHSNEDPYTYEFLVDFSQIKLTSDQKTKPVEVFYLHGDNNIVVGSQIVFDPEINLNASNLDNSFQSTGSTSTPKPDFGKNLFIVLKYFTISLPLKRVEKRAKEAAQTQEEAAVNTSQQQKPAAQQKKPLSKLQLNPNAPLFGAPANAGFEPPSQPFYPQGANPTQPNFMGANMGGNMQANQGLKPANFPYGANKMGANPPGMMGNQMGNNPQGGMGNPMGGNMPGNIGGNVPGNIGPMKNMGNNQMFWNAQQLNQNFQMEQNQQGGQFNKMQGPNQEMNFPQGFQMNQQGNLGGFVKPPGLVAQQQGLPNAFGGFLPPPMFSNSGNTQNESPNKKKNLQVDTKMPGGFPQGGVPLSGGLQIPLDLNELPMTPDRLQGDDENPGLERGRIKNMIAPNLYTAVLSGKQRENSLSKSPSLSKIQNKYFSGFSTPRSDNTFTPPQANTPRRRLTPTGSSAELGVDADGDQPWTEDMIENFKLENYIDNLVEFAKTYNGSRVLQKFFPRATQTEIDSVINKIEDNIDELMLDPYANYMFQTLAQSCSSEQRYHLLQKISPSMVKIACDRKGTHSLQAIVSLISREVEEKLIKETLEGHVLDLALDAQGTHLIQKIIVAISLPNVEFIYEPVITRFSDIANNSYGLCVLKQLMTKAEKSEKMRHTIINLLYENLEELIQNPFGNYAVQHALDSYPQHCNKILDKILDKIIQYSNQKFSSNVIEKCLILSTPEYRKRFVREIIKSDRIVELMKNKYGNFVILKVLATTEPDDKVAVMQSLMRNVNAVNVTKYKNRWIQFIEENPMKIQGFNTLQPVKPSLFKNNINSPLQAPANVFGEDGSDNDTGVPGDDWSDQGRKKGGKGGKEEKSQFFHSSNKPSGNFMPPGYGGDEGYGGFQMQGFSEGGYMQSQGFRADMEDRSHGGQNAGFNNFMKGKPQFSQHQQPKKQNDGGKWGYNNFY